MRRSLLLLVLALGVVLAGHKAQAVSNSRLIDGTVLTGARLITPGDMYSGTVFLSGNGWGCSGTLIAPRAILTAAHCVASAVNAFFINDAANGWEGGFVHIAITLVVPHPGYAAGSSDHDLAIAVLATPAPPTARISKFWVNSTNKPYSGTIFLGGFGNQINPNTGAVIPSLKRTLLGTYANGPFSVTLPTLHVASNLIVEPATATAATLVGKTDFDTWFPTRAGDLLDDPLVFNYDWQKSPYGWTQRLDSGGHRIFVGGGIIWDPHVIEGLTLNGDSGSAVFFNPKAVVESIMWHTSYDDLVALGGVPNDALLSFLKPAYQDDTNYIVGVTSQMWSPASAGCTGGDNICISNSVLASHGGELYTLALPHLPWIQTVLTQNGAGTILAVAAQGVDIGGTYTEFATVTATHDPEFFDPDPHPAIADLTVTTLSAPPASISPGSVYVVTDTTKNQGYVAAGASTTRYYLSLDAVKSSGDKQLTGMRAVGVLDPAGESFGAAGVTIPSSTALGTYYLLACADDKKVVTEISDADNCLASGGTIQIALADLVESAVSDPPASVAPGGKFTITDTALNPSGLDAVASTTRYYLSLDAAKDGGDVPLSGSRSVPALASGASSVGDRQVTVPATTVLRTYRLLVCADDAAKVAESNEGNNCAVAAGSVVVGMPDLRTTLVFGVPLTVPRGKKFAPADTVLNQGTAPSGISSTRYYLSVDTAWSAADVLLTGTRSVSMVGPNQTSGGSKTVMVPVTTAVGTYFVLACADDTQKIAEGDETNNCFASASTITITP